MGTTGQEGGTGLGRSSAWVTKQWGVSYYRNKKVLFKNWEPCPTKANELVQMQTGRDTEIWSDLA